MSAPTTPKGSNPASNKSLGSGNTGASPKGPTSPHTPSKAGASPKAGTPSKSGGSSKKGTPSGLGESERWTSSGSPDADILVGCQRTLVQAQKLGLSLPETSLQISYALKFVLDEGNNDVDDAVDNINARIVKVGEATVQGIVMTIILATLKENGGFEDLFGYSTHFLEGQQEHSASKVKVLPKLEEGEGMEFAPGSSWGNLRIV